MFYNSKKVVGTGSDQQPTPSNVGADSETGAS